MCELRHLLVEYTGDVTFILHYSKLLKIIDCKHYATTGKSRSCNTVVTRHKFGMQILMFRPPCNPYNSTQHALACSTSAWICRPFSVEAVQFRHTTTYMVHAQCSAHTAKVRPRVVSRALRDLVTSASRDSENSRLK